MFSGGGIKAFAYIGTLQGIEASQLKLKRVAGTSAGAIIAALVTANYSTKEIHSIMTDLKLEQLLDPPRLSEHVPFLKWIFLYRKMGIYKGDKLEAWMRRLLHERGIDTFGDIKKGHLKIIISDISLGKLVVIPDDLKRIYGINPELFSVATAIRMSASFPYFFMPKKLASKPYGYSYIVDGGILSNFPMWVFQKGNRSQRPVLGVTLSDSIENIEPMNIKYAPDMLKGLFVAMMRAHDARYISKKMQHDVIFIPVKKVRTMDFSVTTSEKNQLIDLGRDITTSFLTSWPK